MHYEINVALRGRHYFGTSPRSAVNTEEAKSLFADLVKRFPKKEGFIVTCIRMETHGTDVTEELLK
jgi:hypothetical protein